MEIKTINNPGDNIWFFDSFSEKIRNANIVSISCYINNEVNWELDIVISVFGNTSLKARFSNAVVEDSKCFKMKEDLIKFLTA